MKCLILVATKISTVISALVDVLPLCRNNKTTDILYQMKAFKIGINCLTKTDAALIELWGKNWKLASASH